MESFSVSYSKLSFFRSDSEFLFTLLYLTSQKEISYSGCLLRLNFWKQKKKRNRECELIFLVQDKWRERKPKLSIRCSVIAMSSQMSSCLLRPWSPNKITIQCILGSPITGYQGEETNTLFCTSPLWEAGESHEVIPPVLQTRQNQSP